MLNARVSHLFDPYGCQKYRHAWTEIISSNECKRRYVIDYRTG